MIIAIVLVIASFLALALILSIAVSRSLQVSKDARELPIQPIDIQAFRNLIDPSETAYLRRRLSAYEFHAVQRQRLRAMAAYVQATGRNAAILIQIGQRSLASSDRRTAEAARQLIDQALLLRRNTMFVLVKIYVALAWPYAGSGVAAIVHGYERLNGSAMLLGRLQNPLAPVRISAR